MPEGNHLLYIGGSKDAYRCPNCGGNLFRRVARKVVAYSYPAWRGWRVYACNGCDTVFGEEPARCVECREYIREDDPLAARQAGLCGLCWDQKDRIHLHEEWQKHLDREAWREQE